MLPTHYTEAQIIDIVAQSVGLPPRDYQTTAITRMVNEHFGPGGALKILCGCGGGKSVMMGAAIVLSVIHGARKVVITAPTIALCRQLEDSIIKLFVDFSIAGHNIPKGIKFLNVSSDGNKTIFTKEEIAEENEDSDIVADKVQLTETNKNCNKIFGFRNTTLNHANIKDEINNKGVSIFFVCKPSFLKSFKPIVGQIYDERDDDEFVIDISCHDEFHNFISQERNDKTRNTLTSYEGYSKHNWFFSASKKHGERFSWKHKIFGDLVIDIPTHKLVEMGYLVPELKVYIVTAGMIRGISDAIRQHFKAKKIPNPEKFYREASVIVATMEHQLKMQSIPKIIHFSSAVAFIKTMMSSPDFKEKLESVIDGLVCYQMDGGTKKEDRANIFESLRQSTEDMATCLLQHSTCKEGINCPNFNVATICRGMAEISLQQALGRIQRTAEGKETAYLYIFVNGDDGQLAKLAQYLHYNLGTYNYSVAPIMDDYLGEKSEQQLYPNLNDIKITWKNSKVTFEEFRQLMIDEEENIDLYNRYAEMDVETRRSLCPF
jgi:superfamily II DNA or RNA helicase